MCWTLSSKSRKEERTKEREKVQKRCLRAHSTDGRVFRLLRVHCVGYKARTFNVRPFFGCGSLKFSSRIWMFALATIVASTMGQTPTPCMFPVQFESTYSISTLHTRGISNACTSLMLFLPSPPPPYPLPARMQTYNVAQNIQDVGRFSYDGRNHRIFQSDVVTSTIPGLYT